MNFFKKKYHSLRNEIESLFYIKALESSSEIDIQTLESKGRTRNDLLDRNYNRKIWSSFFEELKDRFPGLKIRDGRQMTVTTVLKSILNTGAALFLEYEYDMN